MCRKRIWEKKQSKKNHPQFSSLSEHSTADNDSLLGGVGSALPLGALGLTQGLYTNAQHHSTQNEKKSQAPNLAKKTEKGEGPKLQIIGPPRE